MTTIEQRNLSPKQWEVVQIILRGNPEDGSWIDFDQLLDRCSYKPTKDTMHFTLRSLVSRGLVEKKDLEMRRGAQRRVLAPTSKAYEVARR